MDNRNEDVRLTPAPGTLPCPFQATRLLAELPTRLAKMPIKIRRRLINWGYASADAAIRSYVETLFASAFWAALSGRRWLIVLRCQQACST